MNCLSCGKETTNKKYCNLSCCNKDRNKRGLLNVYGNKKEFVVKCYTCNNFFKVIEWEKKFPMKSKYYCNSSCSHKRIMTDEIKNKIKSTHQLKNKNTNLSICKNCNNIYQGRKNSSFCSRSCNVTYWNLNSDKCKKGGLKSVLSQNKRSKNEIYLSELCEKEFTNVRLNEQIFNGWDADIILDDYKIAILWNGNWHHKKLSMKHSLKQVQNRDKIKIKEIEKCGYKPYIIDDYGDFDEKFVIQEFEKLKIYVNVNGVWLS